MTIPGAAPGMPSAAWVLVLLQAAPVPGGEPKDRPAAQPSTESRDTAAPDAPPRAPASGEAAESEVEGPGEVTRYRFTGLDIEGDLKTPALLQFLARIAGAFETLGIPHRSFLPELEATLQEDVL